MLPRIDYTKRRIDHTRYAVDFAFSLNVTPLLLVIYYPSSPAPSFYKLERGVAFPISRLQAESCQFFKLTVLPDKDIKYG